MINLQALYHALDPISPVNTTSPFDQCGCKAKEQPSRFSHVDDQHTLRKKRANGRYELVGLGSEADVHRGEGDL